MPDIGVIGGSGVYEIPGLRIIEERSIETQFGSPSSSYRIGELSGRRIVFLPRHGTGHSIAPHKINYRANLYGFKELGAERIISLNAVGGINKSLSPGDIVIVDQIMDFTGGGRLSTFYEEGGVVHIDFTDPYCPELRATILDSGKNIGVEMADRGTYICVNGPRLESRAEIRFFAGIGADVVGMTGMPEATLARELGLCFSAVCVVTNYAAGISSERLSATEVIEVMKKSAERLNRLLGLALSLVPGQRNCHCKDSLQDAKV